METRPKSLRTGPLVGNRTSPLKFRIIEELRGAPGNIDELSLELGLDKSRVTFHVRDLYGRNLLGRTRMGAYGYVYFIPGESPL